MRIFTQKNTILAGIATAAVLLSGGCAKESSINSNEMAKSYFDAWMSVNHPGVSPTGLGVYILDDQPGSGSAISDNDFLFLEHTERDLSGNVSSTSVEKLSQQVGTYSAANYYGAEIFINNKAYTETGLLEMIKGMRVGGTRTAVIPSWLNTTADYDTEAEYLKKNEGTNAIFTVHLVDRTDNITKWEIDTLVRYVASNMAAVDSVMYGYHYKTIKEPTDTATFSSDTSFWINYTGRLLNGHVFDTTIEDTAKVHGIWSSSKTYAPMYVVMSENYTDITLGSDESDSGSTTVGGFAFCLSKLRPYEKGVCAFYSELGYGYSGSGSSIPAYAPLVFEIEVVDNPNE